MNLLMWWSLAENYFPLRLVGLPENIYNLAAIVAVILIQLSVLGHELGHAIIARKVMVPIRGITLHFFGGVAEMTRDPDNPDSELLLSIAGPIASLLLAVFCLLLLEFFHFYQAEIAAAIIYLVLMCNLGLALINIIPALPFDGGRILRGLLWAWHGDFGKATNQTAKLGYAIVYLVFGGAILLLQKEEYIAAIWLLASGVFLKSGIEVFTQHALAQLLLRGIPIGSFARRMDNVIDGNISVQQLVDEHFLKEFSLSFYVRIEQKLYGMVHLDRVQQTPREQWQNTYVKDIAEDFKDDLRVRGDMDCLAALEQMRANKVHRLVIEDQHGHLIGIVTSADISSALLVKLHLDSVGIAVPPGTNERLRQ